MTSIPFHLDHTSKTYPVENGLASHHMLSLFRHNATLVIKRHIPFSLPKDIGNRFPVDPSASFPFQIESVIKALGCP
jgi:hypothetical protein